MFHHILVPVDGSDVSNRGLQQGVAMAKLCQAKISIVHVISPLRVADYGSALAAPQLLEGLKANAERCLAEALALAGDAGVSVECETLSGSQPYDAIIQAVEEKGCDLIIMGSHGRRGMARILLGSETHKVLLRSNVPVMVCH